jgi:hypothetical protein
MKSNPLRTEVYFCHQNQNTKNIGNFTTLLKPHNIGTHLKGIETSFHVVPLFLKSFHFWVSYITFWNFLKIPSVFKGFKVVVQMHLFCFMFSIECYAILYLLSSTPLSQHQSFSIDIYFPYLCWV